MKNKKVFLWTLLTTMIAMTACKKAEDPAQPQKPFYPFGSGRSTKVVWTPSPYYTPLGNDTVAWCNFGREIKPLFYDNDTVKLVADSSVAAKEYTKERYLSSVWRVFADSLMAIQEAVQPNVLSCSGNLYVKRIDPESNTYYPDLTPDYTQMRLVDAEKLRLLGFNVIEDSTKTAYPFGALVSQISK